MKLSIRILLISCFVLISNQGKGQNIFPSSGKVGIGTTNPNSLLTVRGTLNLATQANYGGDYSTNNANYSNALSIGGIGAERGLKIYKQNPGNSPSFLGPNSYNDSYVFEMTDTNGNSPDGGIVFAGTGEDDVFKGILYIRGNGRVGIGVNRPSADFEVNGTAKAKEVIVEENVGADFVFEENYDLLDLSELASFVQSNKHLPEIPSAQQMKRNGVKVGELQMKLLQKIEELTLHMIRQEKKINNLSTRVKAQRQTIKQLKNQ